MIKGYEGDIRQVRGKIFSIAGIPTRSREVVLDDEEALDVSYVNASGDTMTGFLSLHSDPFSEYHAATKHYVDLAISGASVPGSYVHISGGIMSGPLFLYGDPTTNLQAATKQYVDAISGSVNEDFVSTAGDTVSGSIAIEGGDLSIKTHSGYPGTEYVQETTACTTINDSLIGMHPLEIDAGCAYWFESLVIGKKVTPSGSLKILLEINQGCAYRDYGGNATLVSAVDNTLTRSVGATTYGVEVATSGNYVVVMVNGDSVETVNWVSTLKYQKVG